MLIPFLPKLTAMEILEAHYESEAQRGEMEAELGSSYFHGGANSWDASTMARIDMNEREAEFAATPEGALYNAKVEAAKFMAGAVTRDMRLIDIFDVTEGPSLSPLDGRLIPEYSPDYSRRDFLASLDQDIPF